MQLAVNISLFHKFSRNVSEIFLIYSFPSLFLKKIFAANRQKPGNMSDEVSHFLNFAECIPMMSF